MKDTFAPLWHAPLTKTLTGPAQQDGPASTPDTTRASMPRFFFHCTDGYVEYDNEGSEFEDLHTARRHAVVFAGECLRDDPQKVWSGRDFRVEVTGEDGGLLLTVVVLAIDAPTIVRNREVSPLPP